jgi:hypothetical protein
MWPPLAAGCSIPMCPPLALPGPPQARAATGPRSPSQAPACSAPWAPSLARDYPAPRSAGRCLVRPEVTAASPRVLFPGPRACSAPREPSWHAAAMPRGRRRRPAPAPLPRSSSLAVPAPPRRRPHRRPLLHRGKGRSGGGLVDREEEKIRKLYTWCF